MFELALMVWIIPAACQEEPGGEFLALQQYHVLPAHLGQMIKNGTAHDAAADDHDFRLGFHGSLRTIDGQYQASGSCDLRRAT